MSIVDLWQPAIWLCGLALALWLFEAIFNRIFGKPGRPR